MMPRFDIATHAVHFFEWRGLCNISLGAAVPPEYAIFAVNLSRQQEMSFVAEPDVIEKVWAQLNFVLEPLAHGYPFIPRGELMLYLYSLGV